MRTNTKTFRNRVFRDLRAQGVSSTKAKRIRDMICMVAGMKGYPELSDEAKVCITFESEDLQSVYIDDNGTPRLAYMPEAFLQPLIDVTPTDEQIALYDEMVNMLSDLYAAEGEEKDRLNAAYSAKRDAVLAINPFVHAGTADPDGMEFYHNIHKSEYGFRPRGFITYAQMRKEVESLLRNAESVRVDKAA